MLELLIIGGGPIGIACGVEATRRGVTHRVLEKGCLLGALFRMAPNTVFFSTAPLLEIGGVPLISQGHKPTRAELLQYYRRVAESFNLDVRVYEEALEVRRGPDGLFEVPTRPGIVHRARAVVIATGYYDHPNLLGVPGEDLPKVSHYGLEPHPFYRRDVVVVGGQNSAVETALDLHRGGARVTLVHRGEALGRTVKYWLRPDMENRLREGSIAARFSSTLARIDERSVTLRGREGREEVLPNDFVFALTGYHADFAFLERAGVELDPETRKPRLSLETMESNVPGLYVAGVAAGGLEANSIFIENARVHATRIVEEVARRRWAPAPAEPTRR